MIIKIDAKLILTIPVKKEDENLKNVVCETERWLNKILDALYSAEIHIESNR